MAQRFRILSDHEIAALDEDDAIAYVRAARAAGQRPAAHTAVQLLVFRHEPRVRWRVSLRVNARFVEKVTEDALVRAFGSSFDRDTPGEFFSWLDTIVKRAVADFYRSPDAKVARQTVALADDESGHDDSPDDFPHERVEAADVVRRALAMLDNDMHREVIELYELQDRPAREVAERVGTSENNVHAISSRFRRLLRSLLEEGP